MTFEKLVADSGLANVSKSCGEPVLLSDIISVLLQLVCCLLIKRVATVVPKYNG